MTTIAEANIEDRHDKPIEEDVNLLKDDLAELRKDIQTIFKDMKGYASSQAKDSVEKGKAFAEEAGDRLDATRADLQKQIQAKPLAAVGVAFGAGLLIALLSRK